MMKIKTPKLNIIPKGKKRAKTGLPPGSLVFTGRQKLEKATISILHYDIQEIREIPFDLESLKAPTEGVLWIDIRGLHEVELIDKVGKKMGVHSLALEDAVDINQRPKFDPYGDAFFLVVHDPSYNTELGHFEKEQVAIYAGHGFVISFQENEKDIFETVKARITQSRGRIRNAGSDYLAYALVDRIVDNYFETLDHLQLVIDAVEDKISDGSEHEVKSNLHDLKKELLQIRRVSYPMREAISRFSKEESPIIRPETRVYIRDVYDHVIQVLEILEAYRDVLSGLQDLFLSELSFKMNKVMQVLTLIATIFIPLTFVAGIYGMNFDNMPELHWEYSYFVVLGAMFVIAIFLLIYFKRKKWM